MKDEGGRMKGKQKLLIFDRDQSRAMSVWSAIFTARGKFHTVFFILHPSSFILP
jgi:hypothetical protein